jgi:hypothetical protein
MRRESFLRAKIAEEAPAMQIRLSSALLDDQEKALRFYTLFSDS